MLHSKQKCIDYMRCDTGKSPQAVSTISVQLLSEAEVSTTKGNSKGSHW